MQSMEVNDSSQLSRASSEQMSVWQASSVSIDSMSYRLSISRPPLVGLILLVVFNVAWSQNPSQPPTEERLASFLQAVNRPVVLTKPGMDRVRIRKDVVYKLAGEVPLKLDLYLPTDSGSSYPIIVLIHGGVSADIPVKPKSWGIYQSWGKLLAASGFAAVAFNHRVGFPSPNLGNAEQDLADLLGTLQSRSKEFGVDPARIGLFSFSAGGPLIAPYISGGQPNIKAIAAFYSFLDLEQSDLHKQFLSPDQLQHFSATYQLKAARGKTVPLFVGIGGNDQVPGVKVSEDAFVASGLESNAPIAVFNHASGAHGFDNSNDDARSREIIAAVIQFFEAHLA